MYLYFGGVLRSRRTRVVLVACQLAQLGAVGTHAASALWQRASMGCGGEAWADQLGVGRRRALPPPPLI